MSLIFLGSGVAVAVGVVVERGAVVVRVLEAGAHEVAVVVVVAVVRRAVVVVVVLEVVPVAVDVFVAGEDGVVVVVGSALSFPPWSPSTLIVEPPNERDPFDWDFQRYQPFLNGFELAVLVCWSESCMMAFDWNSLWRW